MTAEEEVRAAWKYVGKCDYMPSEHCYMVNVHSWEFDGKKRDDAWQAALDFTRARQEQVRQVIEEIGCIVPERQHFADNAWVHYYAGRAYEVAISVKWEVRFARILSRLQEIRKELTKGMKGEPHE